MKRPTLFGAADARPRIHIWPQGFGPRWSLGPSGPRIPARTIGDAVEAALQEVGHQPAVIIYEAHP